MESEDNQKRTSSRIIRAIRWAVWLIPVVALIAAVNVYYRPLGTLSFEYVPDTASSYVSNFAPKEESTLIGIDKGREGAGPYQLITASPLYFDVHIPRPMPSVEVTLVYQNPENQERIRLGVQQPNGGYYFTTLVDYNPLIEALLESGQKEWNYIQEGNNYLFQRGPLVYQSVQEFISNPPDSKKIALYEYTSDELQDDTAVDLNTIESLQGMDFVLATYHPAVQTKGLLSATASVQVPHLAYDEDSIHFLVTFPGMAESGKNIKLHKLEFKFEKDPITLSTLGDRF